MLRGTVNALEAETRFIGGKETNSVNTEVPEVVN
jgi:hypothetical protein